jgi:hypothetical protein
MIVMRGQTNAPAVAALAKSTPKRTARLSVFQALVDVDTVLSETAAMAGSDTATSFVTMGRDIMWMELQKENEQRRQKNNQDGIADQLHLLSAKITARDSSRPDVAR